MNLADIELERRGSEMIASLSGEIDLSNANGIGVALTRATPNDSRALILDLTAVTYIDSTGIRLIYELRERLTNRGQLLKVVIPDSSPAGEALRYAGVGHHVGRFPTLAEALSGG